VARVRLSSAIVSDYLKKIGSGDIEPGAPMPTESVLCETYGVGRSVAREALQALDAKGFIVVRQGSVAQVAPRYHWHVLDPDFLAVSDAQQYFLLLQEARELLEPGIAAIAARTASAEIIAEMSSLNAQLVGVTDSPDEHAELDIAFHDAVARATDNAILVSMHSSLTGLGQRTRVVSAVVPGAIARGTVWHEQIINAIRDRDSVGASAAMHLHLRQVRAELENFSHFTAPKDSREQS